MELDYQEKILSEFCEFSEWKYTDRERTIAIRDCFAISRIQNEIKALSYSAGHNEKPRKEMAEKYNELEKILDKYKDVLKI